MLRELAASSEDMPNDKLVEIANRICNEELILRVMVSQVAATLVQSRGKYCAYHKCKTHTTKACHAKPSGSVCWSCVNTGHIRNKCPFSQGQASEGDNREVTGSSLTG